MSGGGNSFGPNDEIKGQGVRVDDQGGVLPMFAMVSKGTKPDPAQWDRINNTPPQLPQFTLPAGIPAYQPFAQGASAMSPTYGAMNNNHWLNAQNALGRQLNASMPGLLGNTQGAQQ